MCLRICLPIACAFLAASHSTILAQDPQTDALLRAFVDARDKHVAKHPFFSKVTMLKWTKNPPFVFYLERPHKEDKYYQRQVVNSYLPFLERLLKVFEREYAEPLGLSRRGAAPGFAIAVLNSRGSYANYAQAARVNALHFARAHYEPGSQLAVTYLDTFSGGNSGPRERQSLLHEFVHAMQHAYSTTGNMPRPAWFNEGLAEFHSASTSSADSLETPALDSDHLMLLAQVLEYTELHSQFAPLPDLIAANSYLDALKRAKARGARMSIALQAFYAQSAAFTEFLLRGNGGKYKPKFLRFVDSVMRGKPGRDSFVTAFGKAGMPALEASFREYISAEAARRLQIRVSGSGAAMPADIAAKVGTMPPPEVYDTEKIGWRDDEHQVRIAAARSQCARGDYDAALGLLPTVSGDAKAGVAALTKRIQVRITAIRQLRETLLDKLLREKKRMAPVVAGKRRGGTLIGRSGDELTLRDRRKTFKLPVTVLEPKNLAKELGKQKLIGRGSWQNAWLNWLGGDTTKKGFRNLADSSPQARALRDDATGLVDPKRNAAAVALARILDIVPAREPAKAFDQLEMLCGLVLEHRHDALFRGRMEGLRQCVKALAQRAFSIEDPRCLGLSVPVRKAGKGRISVEYRGRGNEIYGDFRIDKAISETLLESYGQLATSRTSLHRRGAFYELVGSGVFSWVLAMRGPLVLELHYEMVGGGLWGLMMSMRPDGGHVRASMGGSVDVYDPRTNLSDTVGSPKVIMVEEVHRLRLEFDGKSKIVCSLDGKRCAKITRVGSLTGGRVGLMVHTSTPLRVHSLKIAGRLDPSDGRRLRAAFVQRRLARLK